MSLSSLVKKEMKRLPPRFVFYGEGKIGKSSIPCEIDGHIFIPTEPGLNYLPVKAQFPAPQSTADLFGYLDLLANEKHDYKCVALDSADWAEELMAKEIAAEYKSSSVGEIKGQKFGKGYDLLFNKWSEMLDKLDILREKCGMIVILLGHYKNIVDSEAGTSAFESMSLKLTNKVTKKTVEWADATICCRRKIVVSTEQLAFGRERGVASAVGANGGMRYMQCQRDPSSMAGNRLGLPFELPMRQGQVWKTIMDNVKI